MLKFSYNKNTIKDSHIRIKYFHFKINKKINQKFFEKGQGYQFLFLSVDDYMIL